ncbi:putative inner membrane transporter YedA [Pseudooceanicola marinus]|uniref:Putative inner membrane transporter YedA n=1 Tax=Pseudooceanicola marinus TaxID=396013 RepID=A0A1X6Z9Q9_9RHOB|nr:EamA family transporter [Pseudooceanicola marinus]PJE28134.1 EamA family transporter [Pseudooceanicola marinus]SLN44754.1 putative inner membrane transporter YedA [Pseudooceanicola marinus]
MSRSLDLLLAALAPMIWGSTYIVTTQLLPDGYPMTAAVLRALPAGLLLLLLTRQLPRGVWVIRSFVLGALNFSIFWWLLFVAAYQLPGGVAATVGAIQPLIVLYLSKWLLGQSTPPAAVTAGVTGLLGVALLVLTPGAALDGLGVLAALGGAVSMAFGTVLTRKWQPPVPALTFTSWQLTAGGVLLLPVALFAEPALPPLDLKTVLGFLYLSLIGGAFTYFFWFRGIARLGPAAVAPLGFLSPIAATLLGLILLGETLSLLQSSGMVLVLVSVWLGQHALRNGAPKAPMPGHSPAR